MNRFAGVITFGFIFTTALTASTQILLLPVANFSGCSINTHQRVGSLIAKNAELTSVEASDSSELENTNISHHLDVVGKLTCKNCTLGSLSKKGRAILYNTVIKESFASSNDTYANTCIFESYTGQGEADFENVQVTKTISNAGNTTITHTCCDILNVVGTVRAKQFSCTDINITGKTTLTDATIKQTAKINGSTNIYSSAISNLEIIGKSILSNASINTLDVTGSLDASHVESAMCSLCTNKSSFNECNIKNLYIKKQNAPTVITIYNSPNTPERRIERIICQDSSTKIVYKKNSIRALEIVGTKHISTHKTTNS